MCIRDRDNPLHERIVVWAGGHVRKEDATNGNSLIQGALREVHEELRLSLDSESLELVGAIYRDLGGSTSKHVALVYQWKMCIRDSAHAGSVRVVRRPTIRAKSVIIPGKPIARGLEEGLTLRCHLFDKRIGGSGTRSRISPGGEMCIRDRHCIRKNCSSPSCNPLCRSPASSR